MKIQYLYIIVVGILLGACSDFLEENSQDLMIPKSVKNYKDAAPHWDAKTQKGFL